MKLNIETTNPAYVLECMKGLFINDDVKITSEYESTADFEIKPRGADERCEYVYPASWVTELSVYVPIHKIRIY